MLNTSQIYNIILMKRIFTIILFYSGQVLGTKGKEHTTIII